MMMDRLSLWFQLGCDSAPTETLKRKVLNVNAAAWATLLLIVFFHLTYLATGNPGLVRASWALLPFYPCVLLVPWLNHLGLHAAARWLLPHTITALIVLNIWVANGTWLGIHYYLIAIMVVVPVLFPLQQWPIPTVFFLLNTVLFIYCEYVGFPPAAEILSLDSGTTRLLRFLHISTSLLAALIVSFVGDWMASQNERALEAMSNIDALTNLANRRQMVRRLQESVALSKRSGQHGAVIFLDLDNFKSLNDQHGHATGDLLLKEVARRLRACLREIDVEARFGGDEFVILLNMLGPDVAAARENTRRVADKVRASLAEPYHLVVSPRGSAQDQVVHHCTASVGALVFQANSLPPEELLKLADAAMYQAKEQGRNTVCLSERTVA